jgi:hypothetical protein
MAKKISRRTVLRGVLGGAAIAMGLPALEIMLDDHGEAYAGEGSGFPKRFGVWFWGNGFAQGWAPRGVGENFELSSQLAPLEAVKRHLTIVSGLKVVWPNVEPHGTGPKGVLVGSDSWGKTLDQIIGGSVGSAALSSLDVSVERASTTISRSSRDSTVPPISDPFALHQLFLDNYVPPGSPKIDPRLAVRQGVLGAVAEDVVALKRRLSAADRERLDRHLANVERLQSSLRKLEQEPPDYKACRALDAPPASFPEENGRLPLSAISRALTDIVVMALACGQTNVFTFQFCSPVSNMLFPGASKGYHQLTHEELGDQPEVQGIVRYVLAEYAYFLGEMAKVEEGTGTLLDHSVVLGMTDTSYAKSHAVDDYPILLGGGGDGRLTPGRHLRSNNENASRLGKSLLDVFDVGAPSFGTGAALETKGVDGLVNNS